MAMLERANFCIDNWVVYLQLRHKPGLKIQKSSHGFNYHERYPCKQSL